MLLRDCCQDNSTSQVVGDWILRLFSVLPQFCKTSWKLGFIDQPIAPKNKIAP